MAYVITDAFFGSFKSATGYIQQAAFCNKQQSDKLVIVYN